MWSPQWAARATEKGTAVVVLEQKRACGDISLVCHLFTVIYMQRRHLPGLRKVLVGAIYTAEKPAKMAREPDDSHGHSFHSEAEDWMAPLKFTA
jgi:hypothetical protein